MLDADIKYLAALAYGEAGVEYNENEIKAICYAVTNRLRAMNEDMGTTLNVQGLLKKDPKYSFAATNNITRFKNLNEANETLIKSNEIYSAAYTAAENAIKKIGSDISNGAFWWDGTDIKSNYNSHEKVLSGIRLTKPEHNIFNIKETKVNISNYWHHKNKKTGEDIKTLRGTYNYKYDSTAAYGKTIFWKTNDDYIKVMGATSYS